ncbi:regulatory protein MgsR [mine drainage metagenome]|uniref:Regulatory protein MgsR n=1 Tax=mine drainage metagenome TaxID=410659 RepID=A0A1J5PPM3_9ZZZZ
MSPHPPVVVHGIARCDTVRRALQWLESRDVPFSFVDFKTRPPTRAQLEHWAQRTGWDVLLNRRGTTWRRLDAAVQAGVTDAQSAIDLLLQYPSAIKRPVFERGDVLLVGFDPQVWADALR